MKTPHAPSAPQRRKPFISDCSVMIFIWHFSFDLSQRCGQRWTYLCLFFLLVNLEFWRAFKSPLKQNLTSLPLCLKWLFKNKEIRLGNQEIAFLHFQLQLHFKSIGFLNGLLVKCLKGALCSFVVLHLKGNSTICTHKSVFTGLVEYYCTCGKKQLEATCVSRGSCM